MDNDNVFEFNGGTARGTNKDADGLPLNDYVIVDTEGNEFFASGFMIFTPDHIAIMVETPKGARPIMVVPLARVVVAEEIDADEEPTII